MPRHGGKGMHHTKAQKGRRGGRSGKRSNYAARLVARGETGSSVRMTDLDTLRRRAGVRARSLDLD